MFINKIQPIKEVNTQYLDDILYAGSHKYCALHKNHNSASGFTNPSDLPENIFWKKTRVIFRHKVVLSGFRAENALIDDVNLFHLETAFL